MINWIPVNPEHHVYPVEFLKTARIKTKKL